MTRAKIEVLGNRGKIGTFYMNSEGFHSTVVEMCSKLKKADQDWFQRDEIKRMCTGTPVVNIYFVHRIDLVTRQLSSYEVKYSSKSNRWYRKRIPCFVSDF